MKKHYFYIIIILNLFILDSCSLRKQIKVKQSIKPSTVSEEKDNLLQILDQYNRVIIRDEWGVPHIFGKTDKDAAFALAYAHAQDDFFTIQESLLKARGTYSSVYGEGVNSINAIFDYMVGLLKVWDTVNDKYYSDLEQSTIDICEGYADGINLFIEHNSNDINQYIYPVTGKDVIAGTLHKVPFFFQLPLFLEDLYYKKPEEIPSSYSIGETIDKINKNNIKGSNVYAISPKLTNDGSTFLAVNSHQPFDGELAWYEAHIQSQEGWNMVGGLFPGSPVVLVGHNEHLGWGHTVNKPDILDIYELTINPENENQYLFDNKWYDFEMFDVNIKVKTIANFLFNHKQKAFWSIHGPVIKGTQATYAIKYSNMDDIKMIEQWYRMNKSQNFKEWKNAIKMTSVPMFNSGYADKDGNIFYVYSAKIPKRNSEYNWASVLPGNTSATLWDSYVSFDKLPQIANPNSGFIQNCNNTPYQTTIGKENPKIEDYPITYGIETHMTNRSLRALETFGIDKEITYEDFKKYKFDLKYSNNSNIKKYIDKGLLLLNKNNFPDINESLISQSKKIFKNWDLYTNGNNINAALPILSFAKVIDVSPDKIKDDIIIELIKNAISILTNNYNNLNVEWFKINRLIRGNTNLPVQGAPDVPRAIYGIPTKDGQLKAIAGDCYILLVQWNKDGESFSESIHQYGSATSNSSSKHFDDQCDLFSKEKFKSISINKYEIVNNAANVIILDKEVN